MASLVKFKIITSTQPPAGHQTMGTLGPDWRSSVTLNLNNFVELLKSLASVIIAERLLLSLVSSDSRESKQLSVVPHKSLWVDLVLSILEIIHGLLYSCTA